MTIAYEWRGEFASAEANVLHAECFGHPVLADDQWDWRGQVERHSLGWVCARNGDELVGFVDVAWDGPGRPGASGCTSISRTTCWDSTSAPAGSPRPTPG
jgi:hypothetical protein